MIYQIKILFLTFLCLLLFIVHDCQSKENKEINQIENTIYQFNTNLKTAQIRLLSYSLYIGEKEFNISYKEVLSIIHIESNFNSIAKRKNKNKTYDYGLCQINNKNWKVLSNKAKQILNKYEISFIDSYYDITLNVMCCYVYLNDNKERMIRNKEICYQKWIKSYNVGYVGAFRKNNGSEYYKKFYTVRKDI